MWYQQLLSGINKLIAPPFCASCSRLLTDEILLCGRCILLVTPVVPKTVELTKTKEITVYAAGLYQAPLLQLLHAKYYGKRAVAYELGLFLFERVALSTIDFDYIVPIPLHWTRRAWRGFNQSEEIGYALSQKSNKSQVNLLRRIRRTKPQASLDKQERAKNLVNAFALQGKKEELRNTYRNSHILLVDDLYTTGATIQEAAKLLFELNPRQISVGVVCRV